jgi:hypothetical protein
MTHWWRAYDDAIDNPKLLKLSDSMHRAWFTLQCIASANGGVLPPTADIAVRLRMKPAKVAEWLTKLVHARLIDNKDGVFRPHNWDDRQFQSDTSTDRVKRYRDRKRNASSTVTCNVSETANETAPEQSRAETDSEQSRANARTLDETGLKQEAALKATFTASCLGRSTIPDMAIIRTWLLDGISMLTISTTVPALLKRKTDMASLAYCDKAVREAHAKQPDPVLVEKYLNQEFVIEGTMEWSCWEQHLRATTGRGSPVCDQKDASGRTTGKRGWPRPSLVPPGYDEATGEKLAPKSEDAA